MATVFSSGFCAQHIARTAPLPVFCGQRTCSRQVSCSTATTKGCEIREPDTASERRDGTPCSLRQHLQSPSEEHRASLLAPAAALVKANLSILNGIVTAYPLPFYFLMAFFPHGKLTKSLLTNARCLIPLAVMYAVLLITSWGPESASLLFPGDFETAMAEMMAGKPGLHFIPTIGGICKLLSAPMASVSAWAHLQFIAFFCARYIWMDGLVKQVATVHSILICTILPPLGFLSHIFTCFFVRKKRGGGKNQSPSEWPAPSPEADQGWAVSTAGSGFYSTDSEDQQPTSEPPTPAAVAGSNNSGHSANGTSHSMSMHDGHALNDRGIAGADKEGSSKGGEGQEAAPASSNWLSKIRGKRNRQPSWLTVEEPEYVDRSEDK